MSAVMKERIARSNDDATPDEAAGLLTSSNFSPQQIRNLCVVMIAMQMGFVSADDVSSAAAQGIGADEFVILHMGAEDYADCLRSLEARKCAGVFEEGAA